MAEKRTEIKDLPQSEKELSSAETQNILGGRIRPIVGGSTATGITDDLTLAPTENTAGESDQVSD